MANARQRMVAVKRRRGVRPSCRKRTLTPGAIRTAQQRLTPTLAGLNSKIFEGCLPESGKIQPKRGAPFGNRNALKHGRYTREMFAFRAEVRMRLRETRAVIASARMAISHCREQPGGAP